MKNVEITQKDQTLTIKVDLSKEQTAFIWV
jgi:hypothetical protein